MRRHFGWALAAVVSLGIGGLGSALAADMAVKAPPPAPVVVPTWNGIYIGLNGGGAWGTTDHTDQFAVTTGNFNTSGGLAGVTYGANAQFGRFVIGYEGDFDWANINGTLTTAGPPLGLCSVSGGTTCFTNLKNFSTARARAGVDLNGWLLYGTGGYAWGQVNAGQNPCGITVFGGNSCNETWRNGWVVGGGIEKMFWQNWSVKVEYLHYDFGDHFNYQPATLFGGNRVSVLERGDMVRVGVDYHFGWPWHGPAVVAKY